MALKRTIVPFYGQDASEDVRAGGEAMRSGDRNGATELFNAAERSIRRRFAAHIANGRRKRCNPGKTGRYRSRGY